MSQLIQLTAQIDDAHLIGRRLDQVLAELFSDYSRSRITDWIKAGQVKVDQTVITKPRHTLLGGESIEIEATLEQEGEWVAQNIPLDIVYEDDAVLIINKPAGLVVHPAAGNPDGTLVNALLHHCPDLQLLPRAGIIHRLDKDTTGLLMVAKTVTAHHHLVAQLQSRSVVRQYQAIVNGHMSGGGCVDAPIGRHPTQRKQMAVNEINGKDAITHYRLGERFRQHTHVFLKLETGRTHQIRVHMAHIGYPLLGDQLYNKRVMVPPKAGDALIQQIRSFKRQALHAYLLGIEHPVSGEYMEWRADLPEDMQQMIESLRADYAVHQA